MGMEDHRATKQIWLEGSSGDLQSNPLLTAGPAGVRPASSGFHPARCRKNMCFVNWHGDFTTSLGNLCHCFVPIMRKKFLSLFPVRTSAIAVCVYCFLSSCHALLGRSQLHLLSNLFRSIGSCLCPPPKIFSSWGWTNLTAGDQCISE